MNINLHIERLVLDGVNIAPGQKHLLQSIITTELTQLLTESGLSSSLSEGINLPRVSTNDIQLTSGNKPIQLGQRIAQSVYGGIGHE
ncbi:MAG: hypothetical protein WC685_03825 [Methylobacter sp.]|jgi:hypothetical protein